ncbi:c-type cytochrome biogenesis protein CcsB [Kingella kingae]|uniref:c-type cytochrome biogenesis protein CcsB n=1 Tax=Kingella kingae TaxID=504 RepID=UPI0002F7C58E|nr:c-type cytochrome biogenesis protein CcsB [Kingella kingae]MDK4554722.1 c-type cytochrome biogenesis protein CcsB [Kingella kingae]MDK4583797.1 c-type cytochrome biogenesis protein CcsB [Kingella kingae]MDK4587766.1 c-type cytochrome biogenesis protein CcsB [Kingella kingae]MDK4595948.1 c-type cytochrome biogenesis protein CcsB [Kingella kingae]MDK4599878.1 c-type cytochrome biogenesis protein CcsB [Kingella kingae]
MSEHTTTQTNTPDNSRLLQHDLLREKSFIKNLSLADWLFAAAMMTIAVLVHIKMPHHMDVYETAILWTSATIATWLGWFFKPMRWFILGSVLVAYMSVGLYAGDINNAKEQGGKFLLHYLLSSQSAIMWQAALTVLAFVSYALGTLVAWKNEKKQPAHSSNPNTLLGMASGLAWAAAFAGFVGLLVRWHESYLLRPDAGHIPVSNLYEVFILFMVITGLMYLYYERKFAMQKLGVFVYTLMCGLVAFTLWYSMERGAHEIQPLIPALQSWWMKIHVPANFIGYGAFCMAAAFGFAELLALRGSKFFPDAAQIEEAMYKAIAVGFLFFTIATILGALWAADAWGRYWSWDPKETWAFIVWLNYAIWLHMRLVAGWRGKVLAWWAVIGLFITAFAFVGVNMFLTGLHSYGSL